VPLQLTDLTMSFKGGMELRCKLEQDGTYNICVKNEKNVLTWFDGLSHRECVAILESYLEN